MFGWGPSNQAVVRKRVKEEGYASVASLRAKSFHRPPLAQLAARAFIRAGSENRATANHHIAVQALPKVYVDKERKKGRRLHYERSITAYTTRVGNYRIVDSGGYWFSRRPSLHDSVTGHETTSCVRHSVLAHLIQAQSGFGKKQRRSKRVGEVHSGAKDLEHTTQDASFQPRLNSPTIQTFVVSPSMTYVSGFPALLIARIIFLGVRSIQRRCLESTKGGKISNFVHPSERRAMRLHEYSKRLQFGMVFPL